MKESPIIIFAGDHEWKLARGEAMQEVPSSDSADMRQIAETIAGMIDSSTANVTLALPASWCLSSTISLAGVPARNRRAALLYRLELLLPLAAEEIAADCLIDESNAALAICVSTSIIKPIVDALETAGVFIHSIIPASIYAAMSLLNARSSEAGDLLIWQSSESIEVFNIRAGRITSWYVAPPSTDDLGWYLDQLPDSSVSAPKVIACNLQPEILEFLKSVRLLDVTSIHQQAIDSAAAAAMTGGFQTPIELRRDGLAPSDSFKAIRKPVMEFIVAAMLMIGCVCGAAIWRTNKLEQIADRDRLEQQKLFHDAFPGHAIPPNIVSRLRSEQRSLKTSGITDRSALIPKSALPTLQLVLSGIGSLSPDARLQLDDLRVSDEQFSLDGVVRNRGDLAALVDSLEQTEKLKLDPPQTEQIGNQGLHITMTGSQVAGPIPK